MNVPTTPGVYWLKRKACDHWIVAEVKENGWVYLMGWGIPIRRYGASFHLPPIRPAAREQSDQGDVSLAAAEWSERILPPDEKF